MTDMIEVVDVWDPRATDSTLVRRPCPACGGFTDIKASTFLMNQWRDGANIQDVWPHVNANRREALMTGYHSPCFDEIFKDDES